MTTAWISWVVAVGTEVGVGDTSKVAGRREDPPSGFADGGVAVDICSGVGGMPSEPPSTACISCVRTEPESPHRRDRCRLALHVRGTLAEVLMDDLRGPVLRRLPQQANNGLHPPSYECPATPSQEATSHRGGMTRGPDELGRRASDTPSRPDRTWPATPLATR